MPVLKCMFSKVVIPSLCKVGKMSVCCGGHVWPRVSDWYVGRVVCTDCCQTYFILIPIICNITPNLPENKMEHMFA